MSGDIPLRCSCGAVRGTALNVDPTRGNRLVCHCDDCQSYAHHLGQADTVLDEWAGTDIFQMTPSQIRIEEGQGHIRCLRQSEKGLMRFFAGCCNTPVANLVGWAKLPFAGIPHTFMDHAGHGASRDQSLGPILCRVQGRFVPGGIPPGAHPRAPATLIGRSLRQLARGFLKGQHAPSPFFGPDGRPVVVPIVLTLAQRNAARASAGLPPKGAAS